MLSYPSGFSFVSAFHSYLKVLVYRSRRRIWDCFSLGTVVFHLNILKGADWGVWSHSLERFFPPMQKIIKLRLIWSIKFLP